MKFVVAHGEYMYSEGPSMESFEGTWRELLEFVNQVDDSNRDHIMPDGRTIADMTDKELEDVFNEANGDGQEWVMVWSVDEGRQVLGVQES